MCGPVYLTQFSLPRSQEPSRCPSHTSLAHAERSIHGSISLDLFLTVEDEASMGFFASRDASRYVVIRPAVNKATRPLLRYRGPSASASPLRTQREPCGSCSACI